MDAALFGRDRKRTLLVVGIVLALFLLSFVGGRILEPLEWIPEGVVLVALIVFGLPVVSGIIAAANAAWNDGFVLSWLLVFAPVFGWSFSNVSEQPGPLSVDGTFLSLGMAILAASFVGTVGYVVGVRRLSGSRDDAAERPAILRFFSGDDAARPGVWGVRAGVLFLVTASLTYLSRPREFPLVFADWLVGMLGSGFLTTSLVFDVTVVGGSLVLVMWPTYRNAGLLVSWGLLFGPIFGAILTEFVLRELSGGGPLLDALSAFLLAVTYAVVLGTCGFVLGRGLRWMVEKQRVPSIRSIDS